MSRFRYTVAQQLTGGWPAWLRAAFRIPDWHPPTADPIGDRLLDTRTATNSTPFPWATELRDVKVGASVSQVPWEGSLPGIPVQRVPASNRRPVTFTEINPWANNAIRQVAVPTPTSGDFWVEGNPNPGGAWDRHVTLVCPETGEAWELIGVDVNARRCLNVAYYLNGQKVSGMHSYAGGGSTGLPMSALLFDSGDRPHRLGIYMNDYVGHDGAKKPGQGWPSCGDVFRLSDRAYERLAAHTTGAARTVVESVRAHGAVVYDRTGKSSPSAGFGVVTGAQHAGSTLALPTFDIRLGDLELAQPTPRGNP